MPQQTNLNISPYYDDYDRDKNYHRVLFKPGFPVQARELTTLQSMLQDQVETFGSHIFKEGSVVIPGGVTYDENFFAVKLDPTHLGIDVEVYLSEVLGKRIKGQSTDITAKVVKVLSAVDSESSHPTLYVKYLRSGSGGEFQFFDDSEILQLEESVTYGNTTINEGSSFASTISEDACVTGSAVSVTEGVFFVRGTFVRTPSQTIILDQYTNSPSYRVGFKVVETFVNAKEDPTLYDNAKGFSNFAAPGADRLKIELVLSKKETTDLDDTDFVELIRVRNGFVEKNVNTTQYSLIRDYFAKRTYDESGDYTVRPFFINVLDSLNDRVGSEGLYYSNSLTAEGNAPQEDLACVRVSPGTAYVKGYEYDIKGRTVDVEKPRSTSEFQNEAFTFDLGSRVRLNGVTGITTFRNTIDLLLGNQVGVASEKIGEAKVYNFGLVDSKYENASTEFDIWLYDINTYTKLYLNDNVSSDEVGVSAFIKGANSGASGYAVSAGAGSSVLTVSQVSGNFQSGEKIIVNGKSSVLTRTIERFTSYSFNDVDAFQQSTTFYGKKKLIDRVPFGFAPSDLVTITTGGVVTSNGRTFDRFKPGDIIRYKDPTKSVPSQNVVTTVTADGASMTVVGMTTVSNLFDGGLPVGVAYTGTFRVGLQELNDQDTGLYLKLPQSNISDIDFSGSNLLLSEQITGEITDAGGVLVFNTSSLSLQDVSFVAFDQERYQVQYSDGSIAEIDGSQVSVTSNSVTINGLTPNATGIKVNVTVSKTNIKNRVKESRRSEIVSITYSNDPASGSNANTSVNDGLTYNKYYGLRVQDDEICLNNPDVYKVLAIYESLNNDAPVFDKLSFTSTDDIFNNAIIGEDIVGETSNAVARVVEIDTISSTISIVYKTNDKFNALETLSFQESNAKATAQSVIPGKYKNLTKSYILDKGQREQFYDYSRLRRINNTSYVPSRRLAVVLDRYSVPSTDTGDVFTVNSYDQERFKKDIPVIGASRFRASDALDFRPRVSTLVPAAATSSPFFYTNRVFANLPTRIVTPNESSNFSFKYYYGRTDKVIIKSNGNIIVSKGVPSARPKPPADDDNGMTLATIVMPPYLYDIEDAKVYLVDNRRYTMRDIGRIEDRVENLEQVTTLSLLEQNVQTLQIKDADGLDRFKSGFFADSLRTLDFVDPKSPIEIDTVTQEMRPLRDLNSFSMQVVPETETTPQSLDYTSNFTLLDSNAQKTGRMVTLKYEEVEFVSQKFATRVENLNPYLVWNYTGEIQMNPTIDQWITVVEQDGDTDRDQINFTQERSNASQFFGAGGQARLPGTIVRNVSRSTRSQDIRSENTFIASEDFDPFMRSRNLAFNASALRPSTLYYVYFDDVPNLDVIPKIVQITDVVGSFIVGETISTVFGGVTYRFRLCRPDHKEGPFNAPTRTFVNNPANRAETLPTSYSQGSTILNIDIDALAEEAQGDFFGFLPVDNIVFGETSGAQARIFTNVLYSDDFGDLQGAIWIRNPETVPPPPARVRSGVREFKLSSSATNQEPVRGSTAITFATTQFQATGTTRIVQTDVRITTINTTTVQETFVRIPPPPPPPPPPRRGDPLAQSFTTGEEGAFISSLDLFFFQKDNDPTVPVWVEIRTMELGTPTTRLASQDARAVIGPDDITTSVDASVATNIKFPSLIYLEPNTEYAIVAGSPLDTYEVFTAEMGQVAINEQQLPEAVGRIYSNQFWVGSLFKSQNGSTWTATQFEDLCFVLYRADFTATSAVVTLQNPPLRSINGLLPILKNNPIEALPKKAKIGFTTTSDAGLIGTVFIPGRKVGDSTATYRYGYVEETGGPVLGVPGIATGGSNYGTPTNPVNTFNVTGNGSGLKLTVTVGSGISAITTVSIASSGTGYKVGDIVGIVTADVGGSGSGARIGINSLGGIDTLYLTDVQAEEFETVAADLTYYHSTGTVIDSGVDILSYDATGSVYTGDYARVSFFNHGMYGSGNLVEITGVESDALPTETTTIVNSTTTTISIADTTGFTEFEGVAVSAANTGYAIINNEIVAYTSVGVNTLGGITRGVDNTTAINHDQGSIIKKYEFGGVGLLKINTTHTVSDLENLQDSFLIQIDRGGKSVDNVGLSVPQLSFSKNVHGGGDAVRSSRNFQYDAIAPKLDVLLPTESDSIAPSIRTVSGTSVDGTETSFVDQGFEPIILNQRNELQTTRLVASEVNENDKLTNLFRNKSLTTRLNISNGGNSYSSPMIALDSAVTLLTSNRLNDPIANYALDPRANVTVGDPHSSYYVSKLITIKQPATSLRVIFDAFKPESSDFRVLYSLLKKDNEEIEQTFELFPGYRNLVDIDGDGYGDVVINPRDNDGTPDRLVVNSPDRFNEYQYTANDLQPFIGFKIKIVMNGSNQAAAPIIKNIRALALA